MRDSEVIRRMENDSRSLRMAIKQLAFIDMRIQAFEIVISKKWSLFQSVFKPQKLLAKVNKQHLELLRQHDEDIQRQREEVKKASNSPKLIIPTVYAGGNGNG